MKSKAILKFGVPKGSLEEATNELFARAGWKISKHERSYFPSINDPEIDLALARTQEMAGYIFAGVFDAGIAAIDWMQEEGLEDQLIHVTNLVYSKASLRPTRWVLCVAGDSPYQKAEDLAGKRVATEVQNLAQRYFAAKGVEDVDIFYSWGATEAKIAQGMADAIIEVTETGSTIRAQGLRIIDEVLVSNPVLVANAEAWEDPVKRAKIEQLRILLEGALRARTLVALKMNVPTARLRDIEAMLPALHSPTICRLEDQDWVSVETVVETRRVRDLIPALKAAGAEGIFEYSLNKVI